MKSRVPKGWMAWGAVLAALCAPVLARSQPSPTSRFYVVDVVGKAEITTGERIETLTEKSVHPAAGAVLTTGAGSSNAIVFSNGSGVHLGPETRLEVRRFVQEPFAPNRADLESEPSPSQTHVYVARGRVAVCTARLVAGSAMLYETPHVVVQIRAGRLLIETTDEATHVSVVEGDVTVRAGERDASGHILRGRQQTFVRPTIGERSPVVVQPIENDDQDRLGDDVTMACMARQTVYFDVEAVAGEPELVAIPVTPLGPPVDVVDETTTSPSFISD